MLKAFCVGEFDGVGLFYVDLSGFLSQQDEAGHSPTRSLSTNCQSNRPEEWFGLPPAAAVHVPWYVQMLAASLFKLGVV